ncbi:hypothetical protein AX17_007104 [Amanita inopinata Kibby_2008]|nr:hypothetical protein AX17_007104 [Amanita inopinata Kibby_2008]
MDDIFTIGSTLEELKKNTLEVLNVLNEWGLCVKKEKCLWEVTKCPVLGFIVGNQQVMTDPEKVDVIKQWKELKNKKELQNCTTTDKINGKR